MAYKTLANLYGACEVDFDRGDLVITKIGNLVTSSVADPERFRDLDWTKNIKVLDRVHELGQLAIFGNYHRENLERLKVLLGERLTIVAVHWQDQRCREIFSQCFAALHWQRLQDGKLPFTPHDIEVRLSGIDPVTHYSNVFLAHGGLPLEMPQWTSHSISFRDFFLEDRFYQYIETALQQTLSQEAKRLYHDWVNHYQPYIGE